MTLATDLLASLPKLTQRHPRGPMAKDMAAFVAASIPAVLDAARQLDAEGLAIFLRYPGSKARHLVPLAFDLGPQGRVCANCRVVFGQPKKGRRRCCGRSCGIAWSWKQPGVAERRRSGIVAERATPEARARLAEHNRRRWSDPDQHAVLSEQNRRQWADPVARARRSTSIQAANGSAEARAAWSAMRKEMWEDPGYRAKACAGIKASKSTPEARALFSELLRARWQDPVLREKYLAAVRKNAKDIAARRASRRDAATASPAGDQLGPGKP